MGASRHWEKETLEKVLKKKRGGKKKVSGERLGGLKLRSRKTLFTNTRHAKTFVLRAAS